MPALTPWKETHLLHICSAATSALPRRTAILNGDSFSISRKNLCPASKEVESSFCCPSHFSAGKCSALKVPGKENCQVKKIYWMCFQKGRIIWHFLKNLRKITCLGFFLTFLSSNTKKCKRKNSYTVLDCFYITFFLFNVFIYNCFLCFSRFCLRRTSRWLNLLVLPLSSALPPQKPHYLASTW